MNLPIAEDRFGPPLSSRSSKRICSPSVSYCFPYNRTVGTDVHHFRASAPINQPFRPEGERYWDGELYLWACGDCDRVVSNCFLLKRAWSQAVWLRRSRDTYSQHRLHS